MFGLKDQDLMFVLFVVFGFFLAKMLSSKKEGYAPFDCSKAKSKYCCVGKDNRFSQFCSWNESDKKCTWASPREDLPTCQTIKGQTGEECDPTNPYKYCCMGEYCNESTKKCTVTGASSQLAFSVPDWCLKE